MVLVTSPLDFNTDRLFIDLRSVLGLPVFLKCEGFNFAGSVKMKAALNMVDDAERTGWLKPGSVLVESSSGNLGVALSMVAASKGYGFVCVTDLRCNETTRRTMEALGARVHVVREPDPEGGGLLGSRIKYVKSLVASDQRYVWLNQYANPANSAAHFATTGPDIAAEFPELDVLFVGAGTTGTLMGCSRYFRQRQQDGHKAVRVVAVDAVGSVTFGGPATSRMIPGLGTGVRPPQLDEELVDDVVLVEETDTIRTCRCLAGRGFLFGGSTGTVVSGARTWLDVYGTPELTAVAIAPDLGERYLDTVYHDSWVEGIYGREVLDPSATTAPHRAA
ncbi:2,3-diaminopropionate biosynthesis protein SbnA [Pseudonocardia sp. CA-107938]|uniref:2,3-diaminopropionate biosynthesis protein SbnA n=1 Tax=Pseudonocardia sp. CA-107938 TaxID=3240021 RepID=UPI003D8D4CE9